MYIYICVCVCTRSVMSNSLNDPMDCSLPGSSVHGILQARILRGLTFSAPGDLPDPGIKPGVSHISCTGGQIVCHCAT